MMEKRKKGGGEEDHIHDKMTLFPQGYCERKYIFWNSSAD